MNSKILILGKGFIGERLSEGLGGVISGKHICSYADAQKEIQKHNPKIIVNCIGHTGRNVDACEQDKDKTLFANAFIPVMLAEVALRQKIKLVHISSGCIYHYNYGKDRPISEEKIPDFFELFYSRTKMYSERALEILSHKFPVLITRIRIPLDNRPHPKNILTKLISYRRSIIDIPNSVTYIPDFILALRHLLKIGATGVYNIVNKGGLRYPQLLDVYKKYSPGFQYRVADYKALHLVRTNLILSTAKLERTGFKIRDIHQVLEECVKDYLKY
jgi:dTDP-4-dehydrorhamnose reductase